MPTEVGKTKRKIMYYLFVYSGVVYIDQFF